MQQQQNKTHISLDLLEDIHVVIHVTGKESGLTFGKCNLREAESKIKVDMASLERAINDPTYHMSQIAREMFSNAVHNIGNQVYLDILADDRVRDLFTRVTRRSVDTDLSISFKIDRDLIQFPIEFMLTEKKYPLAAKIPLYKTITTDGDMYPVTNELDPEEEINVLLLSSNVSIGVGDKVFSGNEEKHVNFTLPDIEEIDADDGEIKQIEAIIKNSKCQQKWKKIKVKTVKTEHLSYERFLEYLNEDIYHIIHYNGHGHIDLLNRTENYIFFWKGERRDPPVVAVTPSMIENALDKKKNPQFVYLSCCQGGGTAAGYQRRLNGFVGLLDGLVSAGVPTVLGMRWPISVEGSKSIACAFYDSFFIDKNVHSIEAALAKARSKAWDYNDKSVWCSPILIKQDFAHANF